jgi:4-amino-4-deoxy-L-arabinose transferase-like glycosyltransferase
MNRSSVWIGLILATAALLLLSSLDNGRLWQDEAETAVLGRNTLQFGYPKVDDGINRINPWVQSTAQGEAWSYHTWLSFYWAAASFAVFGMGTWSARFPFALLGLLTIYLFYRWVDRWYKNRPLAILCAALLTASVPFLLHMRQCRYYAPTAFFSLWTSWAYWRFLNKKRWAGAELFLSLLLLFHSNHGVFIPSVLALTAHALFEPQLRQRWRSLALILSALALLTIPFFFFLKAGQHHSAFTLIDYWHHAQFYFRQINKYLLPMTLWIPLAFLFVKQKTACSGGPGPDRSTVRLTALILSVNLLFVMLFPTQRHFRYLVHLIPWILLMHALLLRALYRRNRFAALLAGFLLIATNWHYAIPSRLLTRLPILTRGPITQEPLRIWAWDYLGELTHRYRGPVDGIVEYLERHAATGETVKIPYEDNSLVFYTRLKVERLYSVDEFTNETYPDWIALRKDWIIQPFYSTDYFRRIESGYQKITLDAPDIPFQNRPDPGFHRFRTDTQAPPVVLYRKKLTG